MLTGTDLVKYLKGEQITPRKRWRTKKLKAQLQASKVVVFSDGNVRFIGLKVETEVKSTYQSTWKGKPTNVLQTAQCSIFIDNYMTFSFKNYSWNCIAVSYVTLHAVLQA